MSSGPRGNKRLMSVLGQKQTCAVQKGMSALPPLATAKADIRQTVLRPSTVSLPDLGVIETLARRQGTSDDRIRQRQMRDLSGEQP